MDQGLMLPVTKEIATYILNLKFISTKKAAPT